ncbi:MAG: T9SS type B sorting domain-containing protein [Ferruginibacter sp.]
MIRISILHFLFLFLFLFRMHSGAQCPVNIDFEAGNFSGWNCYAGLFSPGQIILNPSPPLSTRHVIYSAANNNGNDYWGGFPKICPKGSDYSIRLGNDSAGRNAESISYTFTIPLNQQTFNLVYNYAVVFQDPGHPADQQPRLNIEVFNITDSVLDSCSSFSFVANGSLPGFKDSPMSSNAPVKYKDWSAAYINLTGKAGKTYRISFTTTDCSEAAHFGYAYLDVYTLAGCNNAVPTSVFCKDDRFADLTAPPGFQNYKWFNTANTVLGNDQVLHLNPLPHAGDTLYVQLTPFSGYGCVSTVGVYLKDTLKLKADAGPDHEFCLDPFIRLGTYPKAGVLYQWSPSTGLSNPLVARPFVSPIASIKYSLAEQNYAGGCQSVDSVALIKKCVYPEIYVPTAFTPDGNGLNDRLRPVLYGYAKMNYFKVYNRYGQVMYQSSGSDNGWNGSFHGKNLNTQTVVWVIEAVDVYGAVDVRRGNTVLIR